jgi:nitroimidazol reductase NimA-like FMN-containing flavoprotein (pyridoxamine 5'-phosphate oxidase superfamily)
MTIPTDENPVVELTIEECWDLLEGEEFGRLAYRLVDEVHLVPINYATDGQTLLFRTGSGNKLLAAALHSDVALEIDWHDDVAAWSVVARGRLRRLGEDEAHRVEALPLHPWVPTLKYDVIELVPEVVTGRRFRLRRPEPDHQLTSNSG